jgi:3-phenylpropionate/trans-cinnamate dioxygenase ferredoxin reductase component
MPDRTFVIVGGSLAGATAAATLRDEGYDGRLVLVGAEPLPPYERPALSKEFLRGEQSLEEQYVRPEQWYGENDVDARFGARAV